jgi:hypothetical protein
VRSCLADHHAAEPLDPPVHLTRSHHHISSG